jgi:agmatinase
MSAHTFDAPATGGGIFGLPYTPEEARVVLVPVPWDATTSYRAGTGLGPHAIRVASAQVDLFDLETGRPWQAGIAMLEPPAEIARWNVEARLAAEPIIAAGGVLDGDPPLEANLARVNALGAQLNAWVRAETERWLDAGKLVGVVGGDHATPFGALEAIAARHPGVGVLHVDAHADLRDAYEGFTWSHASIMDNVTSRIAGLSRLVQVGIRDVCEEEVLRIEASAGRIRALFDRDWHEARLEGADLRALAREWIGHLPKDVWISFDVDGLDPSLCPSTGTPVPGGLDWASACLWLDELARSGRRVVGLDLSEVSPGDAPAGRDAWDAIVGARLLYRLIGSALLTR